MKIINELRHKYRLKILFEIIPIKRSTYYYNCNKVNADKKNIALINEIKRLFNHHKGRYGYRRITLALKQLGYVVNHKKVKRLMSKLGLYANVIKTKYKSYRGNINNKCKNLLLRKVNGKYIRDFNTTACNQKWTTDVSEFKITSGKLYLSPILDMHNGEIIAYDISTSPNFNQINNMLDNAFKSNNKLDGLILHSDQGWQYQMKAYQKRLNEKSIFQSMSRKGNCLDNAMMESFFGIMKQEMFYRFENTFKSLDDLRDAMEEYIAYYNTKRIKVKLKGLTPVEYRHQSLNLAI